MSRFVLLLAQLLVVLLLCSTVNTFPNQPPTDAPGPPAVDSPEACTCASNAACDNATGMCTGSRCGNDGDVFTCDRNNLSLVVIASPLATMEGASLLLTCIVNLTPDDITVYWRDPEGSSISGEGTKYEISAESGAVYDLVINNSSYEDSGTYTCVAVLNEPTTRLSSVTEQVNITVYALGRIFSTPPMTIRIVAGDQLELACKAFFGLTTPSLEWVLPSQAVGGTAQITSQEEYFQGTELISSRLLVVTNVSSIHDGTYRCQAMVNETVTDTRDVHVSIVDNPIIDNLLLSDLTSDGFTLTWEMVFTGNDNVTCTLCVNSLRFTLCGRNSTYSVTGLSPHTVYNISLVCENYAGGSNKLVITNQRTSPTAPDMIPDLALYEGQDAVTTTSVKIAVPTVSERNGPISCYEFAVIESPPSRISHPDEDFISMIGAADTIDNKEPYAALVLGSVHDISYITIGGNETTLSECSIRGGDVTLRRSISPNLITSLSARNVPLEGSTTYAIFMRVYTGLDNGSVDFRSSNYLMITTSAADSGISGFPFLVIIIMAVVMVALALLLSIGCIIKRGKSQKTETITAGDTRDDVYINDGYTPSAYLSLPNYYAAQEEVASYHPLRSSGQNQDTLKDDTDISRNSGYLTMKPATQNSIPGLSDDYQDASSSERVRQPKPPVELAFGLGDGLAANSTRSTGSDEEKLNLKQKGWDIGDVKQEQGGAGDGHDSHLASGDGNTDSSHNVRDVVPIAGTENTDSDNGKDSMITGEPAGEGLMEDGSPEIPSGADVQSQESANIHDPSDDPLEVQGDSTLSSTMGSDGSVVHRYYDGKGDYEEIPHRTGDTSASGYSRGVYNKWRSPVPFKVSELPSYVGDGKQNGARNFKREFAILPQSQQEPWTVASKPENIQKNAFQNVLPYDHSRVKLTKLPDDPFSDYYNASFITDQSNKTSFIAAQGPIKSTVEDFWRLIWQEKVEVIVMVTKLQEEVDEVLCHRYWPQEVGGSETFGLVSVEVKSKTNYPDYQIQTLEVKKEDNCLTVHHFHYLSWPYMGVPWKKTSLLSFLRKVKIAKGTTTSRCPLLAHCSNGAGATGVFLALYCILEDLADQDNEICVYDYIKQMRKNRVNMVNSESQYVFIYDVLLEAYLTPDVEMSLEDLQSLEINTDTLEEEFQLLMMKCSAAVLDGQPTGQLEENKHKNRSEDVVPLDAFRPVLSSESLMSGNSYINASFADSYQRSRSFILTQWPMPTTVEDFWRLVFDHQCSKIIMLHSIDGSDKTLPFYWPRGGTVQYGSMTVDCLGEEEHTGYKQRQFTVSHISTEEPLSVTQYEVIPWPESEGDLVAFMSFLDALRPIDDCRPTLVHCICGCDRSAVLVAMLNEMDRMKQEGRVNIFEAAMLLRATNPFALANLEHYTQVYRLLKGLSSYQSLPKDGPT